MLCLLSSYVSGIPPNVPFAAGPVIETSPGRPGGPHGGGFYKEMLCLLCQQLFHNGQTHTDAQQLRGGLHLVQAGVGGCNAQVRILRVLVVGVCRTGTGKVRPASLHRFATRLAQPGMTYRLMK